MQQEVYVDLLFLINFSMDYLCLYVCAKVLHRPRRLLKMLIAATVGGVYSVLSLLLVKGAALSIALDVGVCFIMCAIVFAEKQRPVSSTLLCSFLYVGISMMTGGCMTAIFNLLNRLDLPLDHIEADGISTYLFAILAAVAGLISLRSGELLSHRASIKDCTVKIVIKGVCAEYKGLCDSGNLVKDPISGKAVIVIDRDTLGKQMDLSAFDSFQQGKDTGLRIRMIPINTAGGRSYLLAFPPDRITVTYDDKKGRPYSTEPDALIAPSEIKSSANGNTAIVPQYILKQ